MHSGLVQYKLYGSKFPNQCQCIKKITEEKWSLTLLHHALFLRAQSQ